MQGGGPFTIAATEPSTCWRPAVAQSSGCPCIDGRHRCPPCPEALLKKKAPINAVNKDKQGALHIAAAAGRTALLAVLAKAPGAELEAATPGLTPLMAAAKAGKMDAVDVLVAAGAKLGTQDAGGLTALMQLVQAGSTKEAAELLGKGDCNVEAKVGGRHNAGSDQHLE